MIKYSDASDLEKTAQATVTSQSPMKECCRVKVASAETGEHTCGCGNKLAVIRSDD